MSIIYLYKLYLYIFIQIIHIGECPSGHYYRDITRCKLSCLLYLWICFPKINFENYL